MFSFLYCRSRKKMIFISVSRSVNRCTDRQHGVCLVLFFFLQWLKILKFFFVYRWWGGKSLGDFFKVSLFQRTFQKGKRQTSVEYTLLEIRQKHSQKVFSRHRKSLKLLFFLFRRWLRLSPSMHTSNCKNSVIPISVSFLDLRISITSFS